MTDCKYGAVFCFENVDTRSDPDADKYLVSWARIRRALQKEHAKGHYIIPVRTNRRGVILGIAISDDYTSGVAREMSGVLTTLVKDADQAIALLKAMMYDTPKA